MLFYIVLVLLVISFILALIALRRMGKQDELEKVKKDLSTGKVIFREENHSSSSEESS